jgi:hypothetical protein
MKTLLTVLATGLTLVQLGCRAEPASAAAAAAPAEAAPATPKAPEVKRIVFVDKEEACACTRERADLTWAALQAALGADSKLPVERVYLDTQHDKAAPYLAMAEVMVVPGVYLLDGEGKLIEMLQGELTKDQLLLKL